MAISKAIEGPTGAVASFWVPTEATTNLRTRVVRATLRGWLDQAAYEAGRRPLDQRLFIFTHQDLDAIPGAPELEITQMLVALITARGEFGPEPEPLPDTPEEPGSQEPAADPPADGPVPAETQSAA